MRHSRILQGLQHHYVAESYDWLHKTVTKEGHDEAYSWLITHKQATARFVIGNDTKEQAGLPVFSMLCSQTSYYFFAWAQD